MLGLFLFPREPFRKNDDETGGGDHQRADDDVDRGFVAPDDVAKQEGPYEGGIFKGGEHRDWRAADAFEQGILGEPAEDCGAEQQ